MSEYADNQKQRKLTRKIRNKFTIAFLIFMILLVWVTTTGQLFMRYEVWQGITWTCALSMVFSFCGALASVVMLS